jgi:hypothetical protein
MSLAMEYAKIHGEKYENNSDECRQEPGTYDAMSHFPKPSGAGAAGPLYPYPQLFMAQHNRVGDP